MNSDVTKILAASGGAFAAGAAMKMMKKSDGTSNPIAAVGSAALGVYLAVKGKSQTTKAAGLGLASVGVIGIVGKVAEKVTALQKVTPTINGLGDLYEDEDGNIIELEGLAGSPQLVQDDNGNTYMIEGLAGDDLDEDDYEDEDYPIMGLAGDDMTELLAA